ncbi:MAG: response regulator [Limisphaerales bacterium]
MSVRPKILLLDDEQDLLDMYKEILTQLPSQPEIHLANSGARAIALLDSEPFNLLISDLRMPKMDGLQVLAIVRRKFPDLRVVVMTSITDEQYRSRAYAMGVDLFWVKPGNAEEMKMFQDCIVSLLGQEAHGGGGFRGIQSKSLVDIIQLECLSRGSSVLKIVNGSLEGKIWVRDGDIIDAHTGELRGHAAFKEIFSWRTGAFEILAPDPDRERTIFENYQGLLLDSAQTLDESEGPAEDQISESTPLTGLAALARVDGVEFLVEADAQGKEVNSWGLNNGGAYALWAHETWKSLCELGEQLQVGDPSRFYGLGWQGHAGIAGQKDKQLCVGFRRTLNAEQIRNKIKVISDKWAS